MGNFTCESISLIFLSIFYKAIQPSFVITKDKRQVLHVCIFLHKSPIKTNTAPFQQPMLLQAGCLLALLWGPEY